MLAPYPGGSGSVRIAKDECKGALRNGPAWIDGPGMMRFPGRVCLIFALEEW